jgi:N-acetylglutamate synthase-like GNAT family acetyltransferase
MARINFQVRKAIISDANAVAELAAQLGYPLSTDVISDSLTKLLNDADECVMVAVAENKVIAWIHFGRTVCLESKPFAEIKGLVVDEKFHGQGTGKSLVEKAKLWAMEKGVGKLRVRTQMKRAEAHAFYRRLGFSETKTQKVFDMMIG